MKVAPIVIFAYKRPFHLQRLLRSLSRNEESKHSNLFIFVDGPRGHSDLDNVKATQNVASACVGFRSKRLFFSDVNKGLGTSIRDGISEVLNDYEEVIVLEDDLEVSCSFLRFMNTGLSRYRSEPRVAGLHGFVFPFDAPMENPFFIRGADCLGWATWKDRWESVSWDARELLRDISEQHLIGCFNLDGAHSYSTALKNEIKDGFHSWAIYWHSSMFSQGRLTLFPPQSLVVYGGADGSGTHAVGRPDFWTTELQDNYSFTFPDEISESKVAREQLIRHHRKFFPNLPIHKRVIRKIRFLSNNSGLLQKKSLKEN